jgi:hypothetical protein
MRIRLESLVDFIAKCRGSSPSAETRDFSFACFLRCAGYKLVDLRAEGRQVGLRGPAGAARRRDCLLRRGRQRRPLAFAAAIKDMKALRHNA